MDPIEELQQEVSEETVPVTATEWRVETVVPETAWEAVLRKQGTDALLNASGLNAAAKDAVRASLADVYQPEDVQGAIDRMRAALGAERDASVVRGVEPVTVGDMQDGMDRWQLDFDWVLGVPGARMPEPRVRDGGLRQLYLNLTGDYLFHGRFDPDQAQLANANSTTFAGATVDALNRVVQHYFNNEMTYRWFEKIVEVLPHDGSTHDVQMVMVDGIGDLPTVGEGAAYTEMAAGDSKETMAFVKKGGYVGITLETIRKNNVVRMQSIPRGLVQACVRTRSAEVANIFTQDSGVGPTMADDTLALFHADHSNLATTAFALAAWSAVRTQLWNQQIPNTGKPLALWPKYALLPIGLYDLALKMFNYGAGSNVGQPNSGGTAQEPNPYGEDRPMDMRPMPIPVPEFTDSNDWAAVVDPMAHAPLKMSYANAPGGGTHPMPELYEAESPNGGLMFTNDTLPVKARDWFSVGVSTHVGVAKRNV